MSKIDYNDNVSHPILEYLSKRPQRVQLALQVSFLGAMSMCRIKLGWMLKKERRENQLLNTVFKALQYNDWPSYVKLDIHNPKRTRQNDVRSTS